MPGIIIIKTEMNMIWTMRHNSDSVFNLHELRLIRQLMLMDLTEKPKICKFFLKGNCKFGDDCFNLHPEEETKKKKKN